MSFKETDDIWRLYVREWVIVHTVTAEDASEDALGSATERWIEENLTGRVQPEEIRVKAHFDGQRRRWAHIEVFKNNLKGEFKHHLGALGFAYDQGYTDYTTAQRNSRADHDIRSYGIKLL